MIFKEKCFVAKNMFCYNVVPINQLLTMKIKPRQQHTQTTILLDEVNPILQRVYQTRGITDASELQRDLNSLLSYRHLLDIDKAVAILIKAIEQQQHILIVGDYDADGATSTALAVRSLRAFGVRQVSYLVPNRFEYGYGLTPEIVAVAAQQQPDLIMTVDNGIASMEGVEAANALGISVLITDHHLPADTVPKAAAIVNPNQVGCDFPSKALAGVGVCFYLMLAVCRQLQSIHWFEQQTLKIPNMAHFLDIVALGTVADVVPLDQNNRILVYQGLRRIRAGHCVPGIHALVAVAKRTIDQLSAGDLGFVVGPRLNAAGRLDDMSLGIECLLTDCPDEARDYAAQLNQLNLDRREIELDMKIQAMENLKQLKLDAQDMPHGLCLYEAKWHQGVIGILASRIKDQYHRPVIVFAAAGGGDLKGSARSVNGVHIRDVLDAIAKQHPNLISKFGGHAMAAGLSIAETDYPEFCQAFDTEVRKHVRPEDLQGEILTDGSLAYSDFNLAMAELLRDAGPWGQAFPEPVFEGEFEIIEQRIVGQNHLRLSLKHLDGEKIFTGIKFNVDLDAWPNYRCARVKVAYRLDVNEYKGVRSVQLMVQHLVVGG